MDGSLEPAALLHHRLPWTMPGMLAPRRLLPCVSLALMLFALGWSTAAVAAPPELDEIHSRGKAALKDGRHDDAIALFRRGLQASNTEATTWTMILGLAVAHDLRGDATNAAQLYQAFLSRSASHPDAATGKWASRRRSAEEDAARLEEDTLTTHARVVVTAEPRSTDVAVSTLPPGLRVSTPITLYLPPGQHKLELTKTGFAPMLLFVSVDKGQRVSVQRTLTPLEETPPPPAPDPAPPERVIVPKPVPVPVPSPAPPPSPVLEIAGWSMVGLGVLGIGGGVLFTVLGSETTSDLQELQSGPLDDAALAEDATLRDDLREQQAAAAAFFAGGGALAAAGTLVLLLRPGGPLALEPAVGLGTVGVRGRF